MEGELCGRINHFTVDVELQLIACRIADSYGSRASISAQEFQFTLNRSFITIKRIHNVQLWLRQTRGLKQPVEKIFGLVPVVELEQGPYRERRVAQPAVAIIPVET